MEEPQMKLYGKCPATVNLCLPQGQTWDNQFNYRSDGELVNLSSYTARMQLRATAESANTAANLTTGNGGITLSSSGAITLNLSATSTAAITAATYLYDLEVVSPGGSVRRLIEGSAVVSREITR
jgi:hypothetical protein